MKRHECLQVRLKAKEFGTNHVDYQNKPKMLHSIFSTHPKIETESSPLLRNKFIIKVRNTAKTLLLFLGLIKKQVKKYVSRKLSYPRFL